MISLNGSVRRSIVLGASLLIAVFVVLLLQFSHLRKGLKTIRIKRDARHFLKSSSSIITDLLKDALRIHLLRWVLARCRWSSELSCIWICLRNWCRAPNGNRLLSKSIYRQEQPNRPLQGIRTVLRTWCGKILASPQYYYILREGRPVSRRFMPPQIGGTISLSL